ncbi:MAG TPA: hypothetical protein VFL42_08770 [Terriglobales bacterium]|nr:hypothetical protein [Terriglobales bacterium]
MNRWPAARVAKIAIGVQFLVLIRLPLECLRLRYVHGGLLTWPMLAPFVHGELITAVLAAIAVLFYFLGRHTLTTWTAALNVAVLVAYKFVLMSTMYD